MSEPSEEAVEAAQAFWGEPGSRRDAVMLLAAAMQAFSEKRVKLAVEGNNNAWRRRIRRREG